MSVTFDLIEWIKQYPDTAAALGLTVQGVLEEAFPDDEDDTQKEWDESEHPRVPEGSPEGGEFTTGGGGDPASRESGRERSGVPMYGGMMPLLPTSDERDWAPRLNHRRPGECYEQAARFLCFDSQFGPTPIPEGTTMVHGVLKATGIGHAWVELPGNVVFDGTVQRYFDKGDYYRTLDAREERRYTPEQARKMMVKYRHFGAWHATAGRIDDSLTRKPPKGGKKPKR